MKPVVRRPARFDWFEFLVYLAIIAVCLGVLFVLDGRRVNRCEDRGGRWVSVDRSGVCVDQDGRLLP